MERKVEKKLPFLDIMLDNGNSFLITTVFRKKTFTGLLTDYFSFAPLSYKFVLVRTVVDKVYKINNTWLGFHGDINRLTMIFRRNCSPIWVIDKIIHS